MVREVLSLRFPDGGLIPVIVQDATTKSVLMMAYANEEAVHLTETTGFAHYYSRSGKNSGRKAKRAGISRELRGSWWTAMRTALSMRLNKPVLPAIPGTAAAFSGRWTGKLSGRKFLTRKKSMERPGTEAGAGAYFCEGPSLRQAYNETTCHEQIPR